MVISSDDYNEAHDHGVFALISAGVLSETLIGTYSIKDLVSAGCDREGAMVTPWLYTLEWSAVHKVGEMSPYDFRQALDSLRGVVPI